MNSWLCALCGEDVPYHQLTTRYLAPGKVAYLCEICAKSVDDGRGLQAVADGRVVYEGEEVEP